MNKKGLSLKNHDQSHWLWLNYLTIFILGYISNLLYVRSLKGNEQINAMMGHILVYIAVQFTKQPDIQEEQNFLWRKFHIFRWSDIYPA